eukprot:5195920-Ditylum_brightwellii.AAC.1
MGLVPVILHTNHFTKKLLPWAHYLIDNSEHYYKVHCKPFFSSHVINLSTEYLEENLTICKDYHICISKIGPLLNMEFSIT